jgi:hypothetical protein
LHHGHVGGRVYRHQRDESAVVEAAAGEVVERRGVGEGTGDAVGRVVGVGVGGAVRQGVVAGV